MYRLTWDKISKLSHYTRSGLVVTTISVGLILIFIFVGLPAELMVSGLILKIFATASLVSHLYSNATYIAGTMDHFKNPTDKNKFERWLTLILIIVGLISGMLLALTLPPVTFFSFLSTTTVTTGAFSGLGSRIGGWYNRPLLEKIFLAIGGVGGASMGLLLTFTGTPIINISGVITFITGGPPILASFIFICLVTSLCMSGADYFSKAIRYVSGYSEADKNNEYRGSFWGALLSCAAICYFAFNLDLITAIEGTEKLVVATAIALFAKCFGIDGICSRIGRTFDRTFDENDSVYEKIAKVLLVLSGLAGLMVLADMCCTAADKLFCKRKPALPVPTPKMNVSREEIPSTFNKAPQKSLTPQHPSPTFCCFISSHCKHANHERWLKRTNDPSLTPIQKGTTRQRSYTF